MTARSIACLNLRKEREVEWGAWDESWDQLIRPIILNDVYRDQ
jgi:hypothetical protein